MEDSKLKNKKLNIIQVNLKKALKKLKLQKNSKNKFILYLLFFFNLYYFFKLI